MILSDQFYHSSQQKHLLWATIKTTKISRIEQPTSLICLSQRIIYFNYNNSVTTNFATVPEFTITSWKRHYNKNPDLQKQEKKIKIVEFIHYNFPNTANYSQPATNKHQSTFLFL